MDFSCQSVARETTFPCEDIFSQGPLALYEGEDILLQARPSIQSTIRKKQLPVGNFRQRRIWLRHVDALRREMFRLKIKSVDKKKIVPCSHACPSGHIDASCKGHIRPHQARFTVFNGFSLVTNRRADTQTDIRTDIRTVRQTLFWR